MSLCNESYLFLKKIGQGSYGEVWLVRHKDNEHKKFVLKKISFIRASEKEQISARRECTILRKLEHPNIVQYRDSFEENNSLYIAMSFCEGGDLYTILEDRKSTLLSENQIVEWLIQITMALSYIHERNILHRDLKTQNIFLSKSIIKIGDLGIAKQLRNKDEMAKTVIGTPYYMSPELFEKKPYNFKSDIWSLGCVAYEMATLRHAFDARSFNALSYKILNGQTPDISSKYNKELIILIKNMLNKIPENRPNTLKILSNPFIRSHIQMVVENTKSQFERRRRPSKDKQQLQIGLHNEKSEIVILPDRIDKESLEKSRCTANINEEKTNIEHEELSQKQSINKEKRNKRRQDKREQGFQTLKFPNSNENCDLKKNDDGNNDYNENNRNPRRHRKTSSNSEEGKAFVLPELKFVEYTEGENSSDIFQVIQKMNETLSIKERFENNKDSNLPHNAHRGPIILDRKENERRGANYPNEKRKKNKASLDLDFEDGTTLEISESNPVVLAESENNIFRTDVLQADEKVNETLEVLNPQAQDELIMFEPTEDEQETIDRSEYFSKTYPEIKQEMVDNIGFENLKKCYEVLRNLELDHEEELKKILNVDYERYFGKIIWLKIIEERSPNCSLTENLNI